MEEYEIDIKIKYKGDSKGPEGQKPSSYENKPGEINYNGQNAGSGNSGPYNTIAGMLYQLAENSGRQYMSGEQSGGYLSNQKGSKGGQMLVSEFYEPFGQRSELNVHRCEKCFAPIPEKNSACLNCSSGMGAHRN